MTANLEDLLARVKAATGPDREIDLLLWDAAGHPQGNYWNGKAWTDVPPFTASTDAALALVDKLLPTYGAQIGHPLREQRQYGWYASVFRSRLPAEFGVFDGHFDGGKDYPDVTETAPYQYFPNGALAILAALLTALIAQQKGTAQ